MIFHRCRLVFHGTRSVIIGFQGSRLVSHGQGVFLWLFMVPGQFFYSRLVFQGSRLVFHGFSWFQVCFSWFFMVSGWLIIVPGRFSWFFMVPGYFFMVQGWFFMVPGGFSRFLVDPGWFFMVPGQFSWLLVGLLFFHGSRLVFHGSRLVFMVFLSHSVIREFSLFLATVQCLAKWNHRSRHNRRNIGQEIL